MVFKKAERKQAKLRLALCSPSGGGKTYSALLIAKGLAGKIAMIDTEHGSGSLYADTRGMPEYAVLELGPPFSPQRYIGAIEDAEKAGFSILIIDSLSHAWAAEGGLLDMQEAARLASKSQNSWTAWREITPWHNKLVEAMLQSPLHIIATMRSKQEYAQVVEDGKTTIKKLGLAPVQREGMDYEFTIVLDLSMEHTATASKDRTSLFDGLHFKPSEDVGKKILDWLNLGKPITTESISIKVERPGKAEPPLTTTKQPEATPGAKAEPSGSDAATEAQRLEIMRIGRELKYRDDQIMPAVLSRIEKKAWAECNSLEVAQVISDWQNAEAQRRKKPQAKQPEFEEL